MSLAGSSNVNTQGQAPAHDPPPSLDQLLQEVVTNTNPQSLNKILKSFTAKDVRDTVLAGTLPGGQDPLSVLDPEVNTIGSLYVLVARLESKTSPKPTLENIEHFCGRFNPEHARLAPERVAALAHGITLAAEGSSPKLIFGPLYDLVTRYPPSPSHLTALHPIFLRVCVATRHFSAALPVLSTPILHIETSVSPLTYNDNLIYHYAGGIALGALKKWREAEEFFEICASSPGQAPAAVQLEALKKLTLVQLILYGKAIPPPKYTHPVLVRLSKSSPYGNLARLYPAPVAELQSFVAKNFETFSTDQNNGLIQQVIDRSPRWLIRRLTSTYLTLHLADIAKEVHSTTEEIRSTIVSMIDTGEVNASISVDDTVTFSDTVTKFSKSDVENALAQAQEQAKLLFDIEKAMQLNKEYLAKALKHKDDGGGGYVDEDVGFGSHGLGTWGDEPMFG